MDRLLTSAMTREDRNPPTPFLVHPGRCTPIGSSSWEGMYDVFSLLIQPFK